MWHCTSVIIDTCTIKTSAIIDKNAIETSVIIDKNAIETSVIIDTCGIEKFIIDKNAIETSVIIDTCGIETSVIIDTCTIEMMSVIIDTCGIDACADACSVKTCRVGSYGCGFSARDGLRAELAFKADFGAGHIVRCSVRIQSSWQGAIRTRSNTVRCRHSLGPLLLGKGLDIHKVGLAITIYLHEVYAQCKSLHCRVGVGVCVGFAKTVYAPYMTVFLVISLPNTPYIHRIYIIYGSGQP